MEHVAQRQALTECATLAQPVPASYAGLAPVSESGLEVLVVEDDEADAYLIRKALERDQRVSVMVFASDGVEALEILDQGWLHPDVAIIDLNMPRKDGFGLLVELQCRPRAVFPRIVLTSSVVKSDAIRSRLRGADCFLTKPDTIEELHFRLSHAIAGF
jgi:CheY-like chemotaxis protein